MRSSVVNEILPHRNRNHFAYVSTLGNGYRLAAGKLDFVGGITFIGKNNVGVFGAVVCFIPRSYLTGNPFAEPDSAVYAGCRKRAGNY